MWMLQEYNTTVQHWWNDTDGSTKAPGVKSAPVPLQLAREGFWAQSSPLLRISKTKRKTWVQQLIKHHIN